MVEIKNDTCEHKWDSAYPVRLCLHCGEVREFPDGDSNPRVVWPGQSCKLDPQGLSQADKAIIAGVARRTGGVSKITGIRMETLRAWVGAYCRGPQESLPGDEEQAKPEKDTQTPETRFDQHRDEILADRLALGNGQTLVKWNIPLAIWPAIKARWVNEGVEVPDLRKTRVAPARAEALQKATEKVLTEELAAGNIPPTTRVEKPAISPEHRKRIIRVPRAYLEDHKDEILADYNTMVIREFLPKWHISTKYWMKLKADWGVTSKGASGRRPQTPTARVERLEEILRELEWLRGYRQAVLDIIQSGGGK